VTIPKPSLRAMSGSRGATPGGAWNGRMLREAEQRNRINEVAAKILAEECGQVGGHTTGQRAELCPKCKEAVDAKS